MTDRKLIILKQWHHSLLTLNRGHFIAAAMCERRNLRLGVPTALLAAVAGTSIFASLTISPAVWAKILVGLLSLTAAVLAILQTFLRYDERAQQHKEAGQRFGILRREIEAAFACYGDSDAQLSPEFFTSIGHRWDECSKEFPPLLQKIHDRTYKASANALS
jgi:hypothetical protein